MNILIIFTSYLLGSLPTGFLIGKYLKNIDLRTMGSGSTGATNVLRNVGKWPALFVFIIAMINTKSAGHFPTFLKTFVAPVDPEPIVLRSIFLRYFPIKKPVGSDPKR